MTREAFLAGIELVVDLGVKPDSIRWLISELRASWDRELMKSELADALDRLMVCYRVGKQPSEKLLTTIAQCRAAIASVKEQP